MRQLLANLFLAYIRIAAKIQLAKIKPNHVIGITGSAGKSSCREAVSTILSSKYRVKQGSGKNSETGLPLDILGFDGEFSYSVWFWISILIKTPFKLLTNWEKYDIYVAEMGIDSPNAPRNMEYLLKIISPDIGVFLNALPTHTEYFPQKNINDLVQAIAKEKGKLINQLPKSGYAILNQDDENVIKTETNAKIISFGSSKESRVKPCFPKSENFFFTRDYGLTFSAAIAVGLSLGISETECKHILDQQVILPPGRSSIFKGINGSTILDSTYNASKQTMLSCLEYLSNQKAKRKIAILGDMRELGIIAKEEHETVAREAIKCADEVFTFGPLTNTYFPDNKKITKFTSMSKLISHVVGFIGSGDLVLVKGSQNTIFLETLVEKLLVNKNDSEKLCRRGKFWDLKRERLLHE